MFRKIGWEIREGTGLLTLVDTPENLMDETFFHELEQVINNETGKCKAIILTGSRRHFSAGADLNQLNETIAKRGTDSLFVNYQLLQSINQLKIPVIALIRGVCLGSAFELAMHCHFRICSPEAIFGLPESTFGLIPGAGGIPLMMKLSGKASAIEMIISGKTLNSEKAKELKLVDAVFPKTEIKEKAFELVAITRSDYRRYNKIQYLQQLKTVASSSQN